MALRHFVLTVAYFGFLLTRPVGATEGEPLLIRKAPKQCILLETHWGHQLLLRPQFLPSFKNLETPSNPARDSSSTKPIRGPQHISLDVDINHWLTRLPNNSQSRWTKEKVDDPNALHATCRHDAGSGGCLLIEVDGARIGLVAGKLSAELRELLVGEPLEALVLLTESDWDLPVGETVAWIRELDPRQVVMPDGTQEELAAALQAAWKGSHVEQSKFDRLALSASGFAGERRIVVLGESWKMSEELSERFVAMEASCKSSQEIFSQLSIEQLNFKPANGTHTPRWNAEHMMGRQLLFFSEIYHAIDPTIPEMDLNPAQMPPDYRFAHPGWDGPEEARQMQRVLDFTRRFAYLLDGLDLNSRAPGSRWPTLNALLLRMERHYKEHTANTQKKFELPDWPTK